MHFYPIECFQLLMSLVAMSLGDRLCVSRKGGTLGSEVGRCTQKVQNAWPCLSLAVERPWMALDRPFLSSFVQMGLKKHSSSLFPSLHVSAVFSQEL